MPEDFIIGLKPVVQCAACGASARLITELLGNNNAAQATVTFDDAKVKPQQIIKIIEKEGYKAEVQKKS